MHAPPWVIAEMFFGLEPTVWAKPLLNLQLIHSEIKAQYDYEEEKKRNK